MFDFGKKKETKIHNEYERYNEAKTQIKEIIQNSPILNLLACKFCVLSGLAQLKLLANTIDNYLPLVTAHWLISTKLMNNKDANDVLKLDSKMKSITFRANEEITKKDNELADYMTNTPIDNLSEDVIKSKKEEIEHIRKWASNLNDEIEETIKFIIRTKLSGIIDEAIRSALDAS